MDTTSCTLRTAAATGEGRQWGDGGGGLIRRSGQAFWWCAGQLGVWGRGVSRRAAATGCVGRCAVDCSSCYLHVGRVLVALACSSCVWAAGACQVGLRSLQSLFYVLL